MAKKKVCADCGERKRMKSGSAKKCANGHYVCGSCVDGTSMGGLLGGFKNNCPDCGKELSWL